MNILIPPELIADMQRRLQQLEANCAGCPGSLTPSGFELDKFPPENCPKRRRSDTEPQGDPSC